MLLGHTRDVLALQVVLDFANLLATLDPAVAVSFVTLPRQSVQGGPVNGVVIAEFHITTARLHQMAGRHMLTQILVELELLPSLRVNKGRDQFEESPHDEGHWTSGSVRFRN